MKNVRIAWLIVVSGIVIFTVLAVIAPNQPMKSADMWSTSGVSLIGVLVMLPVVGIAVLVTIFSLVDHHWRSRRASALRRSGQDSHATAATIQPVALGRVFGWLVLSVPVLLAVMVVVAVLYQRIFE